MSISSQNWRRGHQTRIVAFAFADDRSLWDGSIGHWMSIPTSTHVLTPSTPKSLVKPKRHCTSESTTMSVWISFGHFKCWKGYLLYAYSIPSTGQPQKPPSLSFAMLVPREWAFGYQNLTPDISPQLLPTPSLLSISSKHFVSSLLYIIAAHSCFLHKNYWFTQTTWMLSTFFCHYVADQSLTASSKTQSLYAWRLTLIYKYFT